MTEAQRAQEAVVRADAARGEAKARRREVFTRESQVLGKTYEEIGAEVGLSRSRVGQIITGRDR